MDFLEKLIKTQADNNKAYFARLVGVSEQVIFHQLKSDKQIYYATKYAKLLDVKKIDGIQDNYFIEIEIKKIENDIKIKNGKWTFNGKFFNELTREEIIELNEFFKEVI